MWRQRDDQVLVTQDDISIDSSKLTDEDKLQCSQIVHAYLEGRLKDPVMAGAKVKVERHVQLRHYTETFFTGITNPVKFRECLKLLRNLLNESPLQLKSDVIRASQEETVDTRDGSSDESKTTSSSTQIKYMCTYK